MTTTIDITDTAAAFFEACESGRGWAECAQHCRLDATFSAQSEALAGVATLEDYSNWMQGLYHLMPDASYEVTAFGADVARNAVVVGAVFTGTHTGEGGPVPPTGKTTVSDYAYVIRFEDGKIAGMTKIWNSGYAMQELGWA